MHVQSSTFRNIGYIILYLIVFIFIAGCSKQVIVTFDVNSTLIVEQYDESTETYNVINEISDKATVKKVIRILKNNKWEQNIDIEMARESDYRLHEHYEIWITPFGEKLEIINRDLGIYVKLPKDDAAALFNMMTGEELQANTKDE